MFKCFSWICFQDLICFLAATLQLSVFYYCFNISWFLLVIVCSASLHFTKSISVASFVFVQAFSEHISRLPDNQLEKEELKWKGSLVWKAKKNKPQPWRAAASCRPVEVVLEENGMQEPGRAGGSVLSASQLPPSQVFPPDKALLLKSRTSGKVFWREEWGHSRKAKRLGDFRLPQS